jgi:choline-glycine betaine transporter
VDGIIASVQSSNEKVENYVTFLWCVAIAYEAVLILVNVILSWNEGASITYGITLLLVCLLPALSAAMYGLHRRETMSQLDRERKAIADQKEKERLERRQDRKEAAELKLKLAADMKQEQLDHPFRNKRKQ